MNQSPSATAPAPARPTPVLPARQPVPIPALFLSPRDYGKQNMTKHSQNGFGRLCWCDALLGLALAGCMNVTPPSGKSEDFEHSSDRPPSARTLYSMARVMVAQGQDDQAKFVLARVLHVHPDFVPAYCAMAELQMRARHVDEAMETLSDGLKIAPEDAILHNDVGMCGVRRKGYGDAV